MDMPVISTINFSNSESSLINKSNIVRLPRFFNILD